MLGVLMRVLFAEALLCAEDSLHVRTQCMHGAGREGILGW